MIPGLGAIFRAGKGIKENQNLKVQIEELEKLSDKNFPDFFDEFEKSKLDITLTKLEIYDSIISGKDDSYLRKLNKKLLKKMEEDISKRTEELKSQEANKLDIAQLGVTIHRLASDIDEENEGIKRSIDKTDKVIEKHRKELSEKFIKQTKIIEELKTDLSKKSKDIGELRNALEEFSTKFKILIGAMVLLIGFQILSMIL